MITEQKAIDSALSNGVYKEVYPGVEVNSEVTDRCRTIVQTDLEGIGCANIGQANR